MPQLGLRVCPRAVCAEQDALCAERADEVHERFIRKPLGIVLRCVRRTEREGRVQQSRGIRKQLWNLFPAAPATHMRQHQRYGADLLKRVSRLFRRTAPAAWEADVKTRVRHNDQPKRACTL